MQDSAPVESPRVSERDAAHGGGGEAIGTPDLRINVHRQGREAFVGLSGELDLSSAPQLRQLLVTTLTEGRPRRLVVDLTELVYLDSTGLSVFVTAHKRASASGIEFCLANPNSSVRRLLGITALDQIFVMVDPAEPAASPAPTLHASHDGEAAEHEV